MTLTQYGGMTKHRKGEQKADLGCKREGGRREAPEREEPPELGERAEGLPRRPRPKPSYPIPPRHSLAQHRGWGRGAHARWRSAPTATARGGGQDRLDPVRASGARPRAGASQREAAAHGPRIPTPGGCGEGAYGAPCPHPLSPSCSFGPFGAAG